MLTPLDIHNKEFKRALRGYDIDEVDEFLDEIIKDYEKLYKENINLKEQLDNLQVNINRYKDIEDTLHNTLVLAQQTAEEVKKNAEKEAEIIIKNAKQKETEIISEAKDKITELQMEYKELQQKVKQFKAQFKAFLLSQLELIEEGQKEKGDLVAGSEREY